MEGTYIPSENLRSERSVGVFIALPTVLAAISHPIIQYAHYPAKPYKSIRLLGCSTSVSIREISASFVFHPVIPKKKSDHVTR